MNTNKVEHEQMNTQEVNNKKTNKQKWADKQTETNKQTENKQTNKQTTNARTHKQTYWLNLLFALQCLLSLSSNMLPVTSPPRGNWTPRSPGAAVRTSWTSSSGSTTWSSRTMKKTSSRVSPGGKVRVWLSAIKSESPGGWGGGEEEMRERGKE